MTDLTRTPADHADLIARLKDMTVDWNGERMSDGAEPRYMPTCGELRQIAAALAHPAPVPEAVALPEKVREMCERLRRDALNEDYAIAPANPDGHEAAALLEQYVTRTVPFADVEKAREEFQQDLAWDKERFDLLSPDGKKINLIIQSVGERMLTIFDKHLSRAVAPAAENNGGNNELA